VVVKRCDGFTDIGYCRVTFIRLSPDLWSAHWMTPTGKHVRVFGATKEDLWNAITKALRLEKEGKQ
jgi:hypothetical protein